MTLKNLLSLFSDKGCQRVYIKILSANDNSKNQVYFGGDFEILNIFPLSSIKGDSSGDSTTERFKASIKFSWIGDDTNNYPAPHSQLILYPAYPEVRFSGFLQKCENPPSELMTQRLANRLLFLSVAKDGTVLGYVCAPTSIIARAFSKESNLEEVGVFKILDLNESVSNRDKLLTELRRINLLEWIPSKRLDPLGNILPCNSSNCGGYTLEAELGITPNGYSEPDFLGWEVKQFGVKRFELTKNAVITLMTPEPTAGYYISNGVEAFVNKYGYEDQLGRPDRRNFGGVHKIGNQHQRTLLRMELIGFDSNSGKITSANGRIALIDKKSHEAASWSFASLLLHWNRKHNQACYIPSVSEKTPLRKYKFGDRIILGSGTDFQLFLSEMSHGHIYYDPGIKVENISTKPKVKRRSQFRIKCGNLSNLYKTNELIQL